MPEVRLTLPLVRLRKDNGQALILVLITRIIGEVSQLVAGVGRLRSSLTSPPQVIIASKLPELLRPMDRARLNRLYRLTRHGCSIINLFR